jgi:hypothetical protein
LSYLLEVSKEAGLVLVSLGYVEIGDRHCESPPGKKRENVDEDNTELEDVQFSFSPYQCIIK